MIGAAIWILIKKHRQTEKEKWKISEPWSPARYILVIIYTHESMLIMSVAFSLDSRFGLLHDQEAALRYHGEYSSNRPLIFSLTQTSLLQEMKT